MTVRRDHWIGGKAVAPASGAYLPTIDPTTRQPGDEVAAGTAPDTSTVGVTASRTIDALLADVGIGYVDAPVSGGVAGPGPAR